MKTKIEMIPAPKNDLSNLLVQDFKNQSNTKTPKTTRALYKEK